MKKGNELNKDILSKIADIMNPYNDKAVKESFFVRHQDSTILRIKEDALVTVFDLYGDGVLNENDIIQMNKLLIKLQEDMYII